MSERMSRRLFLSGAGAATLAALAGCSTAGLPGEGRQPDRTLYIGAYHWGFLLLDETGAEREQITLDQGSTVRIVSFGIEAHEAVESLPAEIRETMPSHEQLERRNKSRIPAPSEEYLHEALEVAEQEYPGHRLSIVPAAQEQMGSGMMDDGMMNGGMMGNQGPFLSQEASEPVVQTLTADQQGTFSIDCGAYCGYGHQYMAKPGAIIVQ